MLKDEYPYSKTIESIKQKHLKIKSNPCSRCVAEIACNKYDDLDDICENKINYDNLFEWINDPDGLFYQLEVTRGSKTGFFIQFCGENHDALWDYVMSNDLGLCRQADKAYRKYILEEFISDKRRR
jgi:hypothetical protein